MSSRKRYNREYREDSRERKRRKHRESSRDRERDYDDRYDDRYYKEDRDKDSSRHRDKYRDKYYDEDRSRRSTRDKESRDYNDYDRREKDSRRDKRKSSPEETKSQTKSIADLGIDLSEFSALSATLAAATAEMEQKKAELKGQTTEETSAAPGAPKIDTSEEAKLRVKMAQAKMAEKLQPVKNLPAADAIPVTMPANLKVLKLNRTKAREPLQTVAKEEQVFSKYNDPRLTTKSTERKQRTFKFATPGTYIQKGQIMRASIFIDQKDFNESDPLNKRLFEQLRRNPVPAVEWWDRGLLDAAAEGYELENNKIEQIATIYVEHPVPEKFPEKDKVESATTFLTKKEKKKLRRINREEAQKEKEIKVMLGLEKPPEPRVTLANMTRVYGSKAYEDPTKIEQMVRQQMQERLNKHETQNAERKLNPQQKKQKKLEKLRKNETGEIEVVVYKIKDISHPLHRKNIDHTARDGALSGTLIICAEGDCNLVVAEGGPRAMKKFKRLMNSRLKWTENNPSNSCDLVWEGVLKKRQFKKFRFHECPTVAEAREILEAKNLVHYWDTAAAFSPNLAD